MHIQCIMFAQSASFSKRSSRIVLALFNETVGVMCMVVLLLMPQVIILDKPLRTSFFL